MRTKSFEYFSLKFTPFHIGVLMSSFTQSALIGISEIRILSMVVYLDFILHRAHLLVCYFTLDIIRIYHCLGLFYCYRIKFQANMYYCKEIL